MSTATVIAIVATTLVAISAKVVAKYAAPTTVPLDKAMENLLPARCVEFAHTLADRDHTMFAVVAVAASAFAPTLGLALGALYLCLEIYKAELLYMAEPGVRVA